MMKKRVSRGTGPTKDIAAKHKYEDDILHILSHKKKGLLTRDILDVIVDKYAVKEQNVLGVYSTLNSTINRLIKLNKIKPIPIEGYKRKRL